MTKTALQFFKWCHERHLDTYSDIADYFFTTESYIAQLHHQMEAVPALCVDQWLSIALDVFDHFIGDNVATIVLTWFRERNLSFLTGAKREVSIRFLKLPRHSACLIKRSAIGNDMSVKMKSSN